MRDNLKYYLKLRLRLRVLKREVRKYEELTALEKLQTLAQHRKRLEEVTAIQEVLRLSKKFGFIWW